MKKNSKIALACVTLLTGGMLFMSVPQTKVSAETPTASSSKKNVSKELEDVIKTQPNYHVGVLQPGESYINVGGPQVSLEEEEKLHTTGPLMPGTRAATITSSHTLSQALDWLNGKVGQ